MCLHPYSVLNIHSTKPPEASRISLERCPAVSWWVFFQWHDFFFFFSPPTAFSSFIHRDVYSLPRRIAKGAGRQPGQPVSTGSSEMVTQQRHCMSLQSAAALLTHKLPGGKSCLWHWMCPQFQLILILMEGRMCPSLNLKTWSCPTEANNPRNRGSMWFEDYEA